MSRNSPAAPRVALPRFGRDGRPYFEWTLTHCSLTDPVRLTLPPDKVLPVIFVPGIMGSNLKSKATDEIAAGKKVWRLDAGAGGKPVDLALQKLFEDAGERQKLLHPARVEVDERGSVPKVPAGEVHGDAARCQDVYRRRGWGEVSETSYHDFLLWLEKRLNGQRYNPGQWTDFKFDASDFAGQVPAMYLKPGAVVEMPWLTQTTEPGRPAPAAVTSDDLLARAGYRMPVHACGYNWLASNEEAANALSNRIGQIIARYPGCKRVVLVTHSMGGLVARRCAQLPGMADKIAGVVHGVMPALGAAVAYRRCKVGMRDEDKLAGLVIGNTGAEVTAVFAQAPGALQLLPTQAYPRGWLRVCDPSGRPVVQPQGNPYEEIYARNDRWWGLVRPEWLAPKGGEAITWDTYIQNLKRAESFHANIDRSYHPCTYVYYGAGTGEGGEQRSFQGVTWRMQSGMAPDGVPVPGAVAVSQLGFDQVSDDGNNPTYVGSRYKATRHGREVFTTHTSHWELWCDKQDVPGDGTVPEVSGAAPRNSSRVTAHVREQFRMEGFTHERAFGMATTQQVTLYALIKIAAEAARLEAGACAAA